MARTTVHARQLLTQRPSYLKAYLIHSRSAVNLGGCTNNCAAAVRGEKSFTAFLGCVSLAGEWGGACSNCVWSDAGARCTFPHTPRTGASNVSNGQGIGGSGSGGRAIIQGDGGEHLSDAE